MTVPSGVTSCRPGVAGLDVTGGAFFTPDRADVEAAVLRDEDRAVGGERGAVGAAAGVGEPLGGSARRRRVDAEQRARGDARDDERAVGAPHRTLAERHARSATISAFIGVHPRLRAMPLRVVNQLGARAADAVRRDFPDAEIIEFTGDAAAGIHAPT